MSLTRSDLLDHNAEMYRRRIEAQAEAEIESKLRTYITELSLPRSGDMGNFDIAFAVDRARIVKCAMKKLLEDSNGSTTGV